MKINRRFLIGMAHDDDGEMILVAVLMIQYCMLRRNEHKESDIYLESISITSNIVSLYSFSCWHGSSFT